MRRRHQHTPHWFGCLLLLAFAGPAFAEDPPVAGERTGGQQRERVTHGASLTERARWATRADYTVEEPQSGAQPAPVPNQDKPPHTSFLRWVHTDVLWVPTDSGNQTYGLVGIHLAVARVGRFDLYGPPGVMMLRQRTERGWTLSPAFTWGVSFYLWDVRIPGTSRHTYMFANLSKCWTRGDARYGMNMAGLSMTWKR